MRESGAPRRAELEAKYDIVRLQLPKGTKDKLQMYVRKGESIDDFVARAIETQHRRDVSW